MALPASAFEPLDDDLQGDSEPATIAFDADEFDESLLLMPPDEDEGAAGRDGSSRPAGSADTLSTRMAHRVLRDAIALQLARRGFDGLRMQPLTLVAEMAACFISAIGTQLLFVEPAAPGGARPFLAPHLPHVLCLQRHTNVRTPAEWFKLKELFARQTEFLTVQGTAAAQLTKQKQPCLGGRYLLPPRLPFPFPIVSPPLSPSLFYSTKTDTSRRCLRALAIVSRMGRGRGGEGSIGVALLPFSV
jgi:hypothetical protein